MVPGHWRYAVEVIALPHAVRRWQGLPRAALVVAVVGGLAAGLLRRSGRPRRVAASWLLMRAVLAQPLTTARKLDAWAARIADGGQPPVDPSASTARSPAVGAAARRSGSTSPPAGASD